MGFSQQLEHHKVPEWSENYLDYDTLKIFLKEMQANNKKINTLKKKNQINKRKSDFGNNILTHDQLGENLLKRSKTMEASSNSSKYDPEENFPKVLDEESLDKSFFLKKETFLNLYKEKTLVVNKFFNSEIASLISKYTKLCEKLESKRNSIIQRLPGNRESSIINIESFKNTMIQENAERDELGYAVSWKRATSNLYNVTSWLHSYCTINSIAVQKIINKCQKIFKEIGQDLSENEVEELSKFSDFNRKNSQVIDLRKKIKHLYADELCGGNIKLAKKELEERMQGDKSKHKSVIYFHIGMIVSSMITIFLLTLIPEPEESYIDSMTVFFPPFCFAFLLILCFLGLSINILILRNFRINWVYIFEIDPKSRLGHQEILKTSLLLLNIWLLMLLFMKSSLNFGLFEGRYYLFPLVTLCFIFIFLLWPFHCFYYGLRENVIVTLFRNIFPLGKTGVKFKDFMFGDILTSLTKAFASLPISFCLFLCDKCREENIRGDCTRNTTIALCLILSPFIIRFFQCLNRLYYTKMWWPHFGNAIKYCGGIVYNLSAWLFAVYKDEYFSLFLISGIVANSYMLFWDIYMDWNLARSFKQNFFLRDKIIYPKWMYYTAIVLNSILRFTWLTSLPGLNLGISDELKFFIIACLEIYRRTQWSLFRIENENTNNPEKYRTILEIPKMPYD